MNNESFEFCTKSFGDLRDSFAHLSKFGDGDSTVKKIRSTGEKYTRGDCYLEIGIKCRRGGSDENLCQFRAFVQRATDTEALGFSDSASIDLFRGDARYFLNKRNNLNGPMLVSIVKLRKKKKGIVYSLTTIPSLVWLEPFDHHYMPPRQASHRFRAAPGVIAVIKGDALSVAKRNNLTSSLNTNREGRVFPRAMGALTGEIPRNIVQYGSEIMGDHSNDYRHVGAESFDRICVNDKLPLLFVEFTPVSTDVGFRDGVDIVCEFLEVHIRPVQTESDTVNNRKGHVYSPYAQEKENPKDTRGIRDSDSQAGRIPKELGEGVQEGHRLQGSRGITEPPEEEVTGTAPLRNGVGCTAKRTRSGKTEDA